MAISSLLLSFLFLFLSVMHSNFILHSSALQFVVGGKDGWVLHPTKETYDQWASRLRFEVNDTLLFRYSNTTDSVLAVTKSDYDNCNVNNPVIQLYGGSSVFVFGQSGPFYFITGNKTNCESGQKLLIVVLAVRSPPASPTTTPPIFPPSSAPTPSGSVAPGSSPALSPTPSGSVAPESSPASSPQAQSPASTSTPTGSPSTDLPPPPAPPVAPVGPGGGGNATSDINAPPPNGSSATATFTPAVSTLAVSYFFIMALGWSIIFQ